MSTFTHPIQSQNQPTQLNKSITQSQIMNNLNSSIQDLLQKIQKVTNDYTHQPSSEIKLHKDMNKKVSNHIKFSQNCKKYKKEEGCFSISTENHSKVSVTNSKQNKNSIEEYLIPTTHLIKTQTLPSHKKQYEFNTTQSLKYIQENTVKNNKIQSLFTCQTVKEVAQSTIFNSSASSNYSPLDQNITDLKYSRVQTSKQEPQLSIQDFQLGKEVGSGKFGDVYLCRHKITGMIFALKKIFKSVIKEYKMQSQFALQLRILYSLDHPNIVKLYGHFEDEYHVFLLMQYIEGGQLITKLGSSQQYVSQTISQMIDAVDYMHSKGIVHRDIKPQNIVISFNNTVKLCDFGWAGMFDHKTMKTTFCGTLDYVSPQMKDKGQYSSKVDIWSLGVLTYQLLTKQAPFKGQIATWKRKGGNRSTQWDWNIIYPPQISGLAESFMRNLLKENPQDRASLRYSKNHFFIRRYKDSEIQFPF